MSRRLAIPKEYMKFDFYYKRTCFRSMALFYRTLYKPFQDTKAHRTAAQVTNSIQRCFQKCLPGLMEALPSPQERQTLTDLFKMMVYCHRHNKEDSYLKQVPIDFQIVRDPMYKYSRAAQERFLKLP